LVTWTPTEAQGPSTNVVWVKVSDTAGGMSATRFQVIVREVNTVPVLAAIADQTINELTPFSLTLAATDSDVPVQTLTFGLVSGPSGLGVSPAGLVTWTPTEAQGPSTNVVVVRVSDSGSPVLSATNQFQVIVQSATLAVVGPKVASVSPGPYLSVAVVRTHDDAVHLSWAAASNRSYRMEVKDLISGSDWVEIGVYQGEGVVQEVVLPVVQGAARGYRVVVVGAR